MNIHEITPGSTFLSPTGRIWTVRAITPDGARVSLMFDAADGQHGAVMDTEAVSRMVRIDEDVAATVDVEPTDAPAPDLIRT